MSWGQSLVNAQVDVDRAVFEMNRRGFVKSDPLYKSEPDLSYIIHCINDAILSLKDSLAEAIEAETLKSLGNHEE